MLGLPGPGRAQVSAGSWGSRAGRQRVDPHSSTPGRHPLPPALLGTPTPSLGSVARPWGEDGGSRMRPPPVRCGRTEQSAGRNYRPGPEKAGWGQDRSHSGQIWRAGLGSEQHKAPRKHPWASASPHWGPRVGCPAPGRAARSSSLWVSASLSLFSEIKFIYIREKEGGRTPVTTLPPTNVPPCSAPWAGASGVGGGLGPAPGGSPWGSLGWKGQSLR